MIIVTGAAGFIGSNLVKALNARGRTDIIAVDSLENGRKFELLADCVIADYFDKHEFRQQIRSDSRFAAEIQMVFHQGACSDTTEWDGQYMLDNNFSYSKELLDYCQRNVVPFVYASSAAVYGASTTFTEHPDNEKPLNVYGYSKLLFDQHVRFHQQQHRQQVVGLRYFNVYGPGEQFKGNMASVAHKMTCQLQQGEEVTLFSGHDGYTDGEQMRDFIHVDDVVAVNLWLLDNPTVSGIFNVGTGQAQTFNAVADAVIAQQGHGNVRYIPFPDELKSCYQSFTEADISALRAAGYDRTFKSVDTALRA